MTTDTSNKVSILIMQKSDLLEIEKASVIAEKLGISKSAVSQWGKIIPELSAKKLLELNPSLPHEYKRLDEAS